MKENKLKVAIVAPNYRDNGLGGIQTYFDELIPRLSKLEFLDLTIFCPRDAFDHHPINVKKIEVFPKVRKRSGPLFSILSLFSKKIIDEINNFDVAFFPVTTAVNLRKFRIPVLITLHDVQHLDLPKNFSLVDKIFRHFTYDNAAKKATGVVTISEFSATQISKHLKIDKNRIHIINNGVDSRFYQSEVIREKSDFLLYPARGWAHKNHPRLFQAVRELSEEGLAFKLLLTGKPPQIPNDLSTFVKNCGQVEVSQLSDLYRKAKGMIFPSLYEGFGLPVIEAMALGCPVASSAKGALPDVYGDAAYTFDPESVSEIKDAIKFLLSAPHNNLIDAGLQNAKRFSWEKATEQHAKLLLEISIKK